MNDHEIRRLSIVNRGRQVGALYREPETEDYAGNPLIEALPPVLTAEQAMMQLAHYPPYAENQRKAPDHIRYHLIQNGMRFFAPLDIHLDLERRFSCLMRVGYAGRNPLAIGFWEELAARVDDCSQYAELSQVRRRQWPITASGFSIVGMSGVGKSFSVERILSLYPQVIHHSQYRGCGFTHSQITWLKLDCPFDGNTKGLCIEFFKAIDGLLGTNYRRNYAGGRRLQDEMLADMSLVAANHCLGVLVIDEIQRLSQAKSGGAERMLNFFVQLVNTIGVPVVLIGTYKALAILSGEFSQMRRGTGQGDLIWDRMAQDEQWQLFIESLWRFQYTRKRRMLNDDPALSATLYDETQGIADLAVKLYMFAQERAIESGKEDLTSAVIRSAARDKLRLPKPVLDALRLGDKRVLERFEDVYPPTLSTYLPSQLGDVRITNRLVSETVNEISLLTVEECKSESCAECQTVQGETPDDALPGLVAPAHNKANRKKDKRGKNGDEISEVAADRLPRLAMMTAIKPSPNIYEKLEKAGHLRPVSEYLEDNPTR